MANQTRTPIDLMMAFSPASAKARVGFGKQPGF
jgi:hypothetical protein